ncbi:endonuclease/exonuclease/phosphatase family protein [Lactobacillus colini]|uniref:endonuclease/exonuclease/phosphatase family protein n=1 Tax=Lactobacillus colini TaxID=1819254 RepID=UPI001AE8B15A
MKVIKRIGWIILGIIVALLIIVGCYVGYMQSHYYRIPDNRKLTIHNNQKDELILGKSYTATTYNVGFGAYTHDFDFFMDYGELKNGKKTHGQRGTAKSRETVIYSTNGVISTMKKLKPDFMFFQEIDTNSTRSHHVNQVKMLDNKFSDYANVFANNFHTAFLAWPLYDPHGSVESGLLSMSKYRMTSAIRRKYPITSAFVTKFTDLDRCFAVMKFPVKGGKKLIMINSHMSAYDKGGKMRKAQMKLLSNVIEKEYKKGNYVIVGGDFNHALGRDMLTHFQHQEKIPNWISVLDQKMLPPNFKIVKAQNRNEIATVRSTDMKYNPKVNYMTVCDGFIVSQNVQAKAYNIDTDFRYSDHNPAELTFKLKK